MAEYEIDLSSYINEPDFAVRFDSAEQAEAYLAAIRELDDTRCSFWSNGEAAVRFDSYKESGEDLTMILNYVDSSRNPPVRSLLQCGHRGWVEDLQKTPAVHFTELLSLDEIEESNDSLEALWR